MGPHVHWKRLAKLEFGWSGRKLFEIRNQTANENICYNDGRRRFLFKNNFQIRTNSIAYAESIVPNETSCSPRRLGIWSSATSQPTYVMKSICMCTYARMRIINFYSPAECSCRLPWFSTAIKETDFTLRAQIYNL